MAKGLQETLRLVTTSPLPPPSQWCQVLFLVAAGAVLTMTALPESLRMMLFDYGVRNSGSNGGGSGGGGGASDTGGTGGTGGTASSLSSSSPSSSATKNQQPSRLGSLLAAATGFGRVPHTWFAHFYVLSVAASVFWAWQFLTHGSVLEALALAEKKSSHSNTQLHHKTDTTQAIVRSELAKVLAAWTMMALQGARRLYESLFVFKPGKASYMSVAHWALGMSFYATISVSVWIEQSDAILDFWETHRLPPILSPRPPLAAALALYLWAWTKQHQCHVHLASLKKYTLPTAGLFQFLVCPHYTCECLIYLAIALMAAPTDRWFSGPVISGLFFTMANLGATAVTMRQWYAQKFGAQAVASRWAMIPFVL